MAKRDKEAELRAQGMSYMLKYCKEKGVEAGELELKRRGYLGITIGVTTPEAQRVMSELADNVYTMMLMAMMYTCNQTFGFGKERLIRLKESFDEIVKQTCDLDYMCQHYVSMVDYAHEISEKYGIELDIDKIKHLQQTYDKGEDTFRMCKIDRVIEVLASNGYEDASDFLMSKLV